MGNQISTVCGQVKDAVSRLVEWVKETIGGFLPELPSYRNTLRFIKRFITSASILVGMSLVNMTPAAWVLILAATLCGMNIFGNLYEYWFLEPEAEQLKRLEQKIKNLKKDIQWYKEQGKDDWIPDVEKKIAETELEIKEFYNKELEKVPKWFWHWDAVNCVGGLVLGTFEFLHMYKIFVHFHEACHEIGKTLKMFFRAMYDPSSLSAANWEHVLEGFSDLTNTLALTAGISRVVVGVFVFIAEVIHLIYHAVKKAVFGSKPDSGSILSGLEHLKIE